MVYLTYNEGLALIDPDTAQIDNVLTNEMLLNSLAIFKIKKGYAIVRETEVSFIEEL